MTLWNELISFVEAWLPNWFFALTLFVGFVGIGLTLQRILSRFIVSRTPSSFLAHAIDRTRRLLRYAIVLVAAGLAISLWPMSPALENNVHHVFAALFVVQVGWIGLTAVNLAMDRYVRRLDLNASDNLLARKAATQMRIFRRSINVVIGVLTTGLALMSFDAVRQFGVSLFAGAGIAGIVAGLAARPMLENLIAGVQLALTQPLRLEDAVVINNEWGWVEEINSTYIVVRLWDWRRQIVPLSYLFQNPFANWTRSSLLYHRHCTDLRRLYVAHGCGSDEGDRDCKGFPSMGWNGRECPSL